MQDNEGEMLVSCFGSNDNPHMFFLGGDVSDEAEVSHDGE